MGERMLHLPVRVGDIELGRAVTSSSIRPTAAPSAWTSSAATALIDTCRSRPRRHPDWIDIPSPLHLLDLEERLFYRREATTLRSLRGREK